MLLQSVLLARSPGPDEPDDAGLLIPERIDRAIDSALRDQDRSVRRFAVDLLTSHSTPSASLTEALVPMLDEKIQVALATARLIRQIGPEAEAAKTKLAEVLSHPRPEMRHAAASARAQIAPDGVELVPVLAESLRSLDHEARAHAVEDLTALGSRSLGAIPTVIDLIIDDDRKGKGTTSGWSRRRESLVTDEFASLFSAVGRFDDTAFRFS